jgi:multidrug efflux pump subunit AcrA (membrane-fusion protein)
LKQEQARQAIAQEEWELLGDTITPDKANRELALRIPQIESAEAALAAAQSTLFKAELDLERCTLLAPFNALVLSENVDPGQLVNPQTEIALLAGTDRYWVRVSVPTEYLPWIEIPKEGTKGSEVKITQKTGSKSIFREGNVIRLLGDLDTNGRMARLLISIDDPLNLNKNRDQLPLLLGSYVTVEIAGKTMKDIMVVPRNAIRNLDGEVASNDQDYEGIWIMDRDDRLQIEPVKVVWRSQESVFITSEIRDGVRLVTSSIPTPIRGMKLTTHLNEVKPANVPAVEE